MYTNSDISFVAKPYLLSKGERSCRMKYRDFIGNPDLTELMIINHKNKNLTDLDLIKEEEEEFIDKLCKKLSDFHNKELVAYIQDQLDINGRWKKIIDEYQSEVFESFDFENSDEDCLDNTLKKDIENIRIINEFKDFLITRVTDTINYLAENNHDRNHNRKSALLLKVYSDYNIHLSKKGEVSLQVEVYYPSEKTSGGSSVRIIRGLVDSMALNFHKDLDELERLHKRLVIYIINLIKKSEDFDKYAIFLKKIFGKWKAKYLRYG